MIVNQTACDLCATVAVPDESGNTNFSQLTISGYGRSLVRHHHSSGAQAIDLCPPCAKGVAAWLNDAKAKAKAVKVPTAPTAPEAAAAVPPEAPIAEPTQT